MDYKKLQEYLEHAGTCMKPSSNNFESEDYCISSDCTDCEYYAISFSELKELLKEFEKENKKSK